MNERVRNLAAIFRRILHRIALINPLQVLTHHQDIDRFFRKLQPADIAQLWVRAQRVKLVIKIESAANVVNEPASRRAGQNCAARSKNLAAKFDDLAGKVLARASS